ncbi:hypothetical protein GcM3_220021, partial [Golovinomyces cichoracearum]
MDDSFTSGPKPPSLVLDENFREFFRNQELWLKTRGWLYVFEQTREEFASIPGNDVRKLEKEITHWKKESGLSIKRAWVQLNELRSKLVEADPIKSNSYSEASLFGFLLEGLDNKIYKTAKNVLDLQPNLTRKQRLDSLQKNFEEKEADADQDLSALAARNTDYNRGRSSRNDRQTLNNYPQRRSPLHHDQST